jgi:TolA-binding protein
MSIRPDDLDEDEREALSGLEDQLETIRRRHEGDPPIEVLRAARAGALPDEAQAKVAGHLAQSAWSRALVEGLEDGGDAPALDRVGEERLLARIRAAVRSDGTTADRRSLGGGRSVPASPPQGAGRRWAPWAYGGAALAASVLIAVAVSRTPEPASPSPTQSSPASSSAVPAAPESPAPPVLLAFSKPDIKLSPAALTWRGAPAENPFLLNLKPAVDAYRDGDYAQADARFTELSLQYPRAVEVAFFLGVTRMLRDDFAGAVAPLADAVALGEPTFADDAAWYLAVAEQRSGRTADARRRLGDLCRGGGSRASDACAAEQQVAAPRPITRP